jgi:hypothetical protein
LPRSSGSHCCVLASLASFNYMGVRPLPRREGHELESFSEVPPRSRWDERAAKAASAIVAHQGGGEARRGDRGIVSCKRSTRQHADLYRRASSDEASRARQAAATRLTGGVAQPALYAVARITNAPRSSPGVSSRSVTLTLLTSANRGPRRISATSASTAAGGPRISASTAPSYRLRTQPETPRLSAARRVNSR